MEAAGSCEVMVRTYHSTHCHIPVIILMFTACASWCSVKFALDAARNRWWSEHYYSIRI